MRTRRRSGRFAKSVDAVTYEFENIPVEAAHSLAARVPVLPDPKVLATTQDRIAEKDFVTALGIGTAPYAAISTASELCAAIERIGRPAVLKTRRFGYDGKGQATIGPDTVPEAAWNDVGRLPCILEAFVPFAREVSVVAARGHDGTVECFDVTENEHRDHILKVSRVPAALPDPAAQEARRIAETIAHRFGYVGVLAVEMFALGDGGLLVNEIAPRVHNSGHWTLDGASVSQFEQHIRAVAGWPLAEAAPPRPRGNDQPHRRRGRGLPEMAHRPRRRGASLRQGQRAAGPEDGACDAGLCRLAAPRKPF